MTAIAKRRFMSPPFTQYLIVIPAARHQLPASLLRYPFRSRVDGEESMTEPELITKIASSDSFQASEQVGPLLEFIYKRQVAGEKTLARDIETDHFGRPKTSHLFNPKRARERVRALRGFLGRYYATGHIDELVCSVEGSQANGYRVIFRQVRPERIASDNFWEAHLASEKEMTVIGDALLFFYEHTEGRLIRYVDTNIEGTNRDLARKKLDDLHWAHRDEVLVAGHLYVDVGSIMASEIVRDYFWDSWQKRVAFTLEKDDPRGRWTSQSPILISTPRTNSYTDGVFRKLPPDKLAYRFPKDKFACVEIASGPTDFERARIARYKDRVAWLDARTFTTIESTLTLGVISRIPNPHGDGGTLTFIGTDATWSARQMAEVVTDERSIRRMFDAMKWSYAEAVPEAFEILFSIELFPGNQSDKAGAPQVISWRPKAED
jgi:hypothetical protein